MSEFQVHLEEARLALNERRFAAVADALQKARRSATSGSELARTVDLLGALLAHRGDAGLALRHHLEAARIARKNMTDWNGEVGPARAPRRDGESKDPILEANLLGSAGALAQLTDAPKIAEASLRRAMDLLAAAEDPPRSLVAETAFNLGVFLTNTGQAAAAIPYLEQALSLDRELPEGTPGRAATLMGSLLRLAAAHRRCQTASALNKAVELSIEAISLATLLGPSALATTRLELAAIEFARGDLLAAMEATRKAIDVIEDAPSGSVPDEAFLLGRAYIEMGLYARRLGRTKAARESLLRAADWARRADNAALVGTIARELNRLESDEPL